MPCEALIKIGSNTHTNADKDRCGSFKEGDIVEIRKSVSTKNAKAKMECLNNFLVIRITDLTYAEALKYMKPRTEDASYETEVDSGIITRRRYCVDVSKFDLVTIRNSDWLVPEIAKADIIDKAITEIF